MKPKAAVSTEAPRYVYHEGNPGNPGASWSHELIEVLGPVVLRWVTYYKEGSTRTGGPGSNLLDSDVCGDPYSALPTMTKDKFDCLWNIARTTRHEDYT